MNSTKTFAHVEIKDEDKGTVSAVFSTFDVVDLDGDVTRKGAFTPGAPVVVSAYGHMSWDGELPVGKGTIRETDTEAICDMQFFMDTTHGRDTFQTVKELSAAGLQEWSYSLHNIRAERGEFDGREVRFINKVDVKEVSPVLKGAGVNTRTLRVKSGDLRFSEHIAAVVAACGELRERAAEVVALRAEKGKTISDSTLTLLKQWEDEVREIDALVKSLTEEPPPDTSVDEFAREVARFVALTRGVTTTQ